MTVDLANLPGKGTFARGVHPPGHKKLAEEMAIEVIPAPKAVMIPLLQHTGAPCEATVAMRDEVSLGDQIGASSAFISAPVHASITGKVGKQGVTTLPNGRHVPAIPIKAGEEEATEGQALIEDIYGGNWPTEGLDRYEANDIVEGVREAGIVGLGGAAFPTTVKLVRNKEKPVDTLLLNGCECEPYLTADYRVMLQYPAPIITGALLAAHACGAKSIVIAVEDNKPKAIAELKKAAKGTPVQVATVATKYPMGGERSTIQAVLKREVPTGGLPLDVGVVVINVGTSAAIARAVLRKKPLTHRIVSVTGDGIVQPRNLLVPVGISYGELIEFCGGLKEDAARVVAGGPMMGFTLGDFSAPVTKGTSGITVLTKDDIKKSDETACVRCGRCVDVCPLNLVPTKIALACRNKNWDLAKQYHLMACCECGCCAYSCPASIPLVQLMRVGKAQAPRD